MTIQQTDDNTFVNKALDDRAKSFYFRHGKRCFDVTLAVFLLPFFVVLFGVVSICYLRSGNIIFAQERVGKKGTTFHCYKFRSMHLDAEKMLYQIIAKNEEIALEWNTYQKLERDPRITTIGGLLRKLRLDEFPQIINVLLGDMSFVGPRPFTVEQLDTYKSSGSNAYFELLPGVTGHWQLDQPPKSPFSDRPVFDDQYYADLSFVGDLKYIVRTGFLPFKFNGK